MRRVVTDARVGGRLDEGERQGEDDPAEQRHQHHLLGPPEALDHRPPERGAGELDERPEAEQQANLRRVHAYLLEVDGDEGEERPEGGEEEEVERLGDEQRVADVGE